LRARVSGEVVGVSPEFIDGGMFEQGEVMLTIDPSDYRLALEQKRAAVAEAEYQLRLEEGRRDVALREWDLIASGEGVSAEDRDLALRVPHLAYRTAKLTAARAELEKAGLNLARTEVRAPFNAVVLDRRSNLGAQATAQDVLAVLAGTDRFYVRVALPVDSLQWMTCDPEEGSPATMVRSSGEVRSGRVVRLERDLEETGRMARVLIEVENPMAGNAPLLLNEYVRVEIAGSRVEAACSIPRSALHNDRFIWIATPQNTLEIREVEVLWRDADQVIISGKRCEDELLVLTNLSAPVNGMKLRIEGDSPVEQRGERPIQGADENEK
jgi:RND family efflux transporter MFP subunit